MDELKKMLRKHLSNSSLHSNLNKPNTDEVVDNLDEDEVRQVECTAKEADEWSKWGQKRTEKWDAKKEDAA